MDAVVEIDNGALRASFFHLLADTFVRDVPPVDAAADWSRYVADTGPYYPNHLRGFVRDGACMAAYLLEERQMSVGPVRLRAGCVVAVVTHPAYRHQGMGSALMRDAAAYARSCGFALLFLHGRPNFYDQFGYVDFFDATVHAISRADIKAHAPGPCATRLAQPGDAPAMLELYLRHFGEYAGRSERALPQQAFQLRFARSLLPSRYILPDGIPYTAPIVALDACERPRGYLYAAWGHKRGLGWEAAADDWPAALALLQHHDRLLETAAAPPEEIIWPLPPGSHTFFVVADHLPVRSQSTQHPNAGWMLCPLDMGAMISAFLPHWRARRRACAWPWPGTIRLDVDGQSWALRCDEAGLQLEAGTSGASYVVRFSARVLVQVLFGYRPLAWAADQPGQVIPAAVMPVLEVLLQGTQAWIPASDGA